jgi:hypothetical protein
MVLSLDPLTLDGDGLHQVGDLLSFDGDNSVAPAIEPSPVVTIRR